MQSWGLHRVGWDGCGKHKLIISNPLCEGHICLPTRCPTRLITHRSLLTCDCCTCTHTAKTWGVLAVETWRHGDIWHVMLETINSKRINMIILVGGKTKLQVLKIIKGSKMATFAMCHIQWVYYLYENGFILKKTRWARLLQRQGQSQFFVSSSLSLRVDLCVPVSQMRLIKFSAAGAISMRKESSAWPRVFISQHHHKG